MAIRYCCCFNVNTSFPNMVTYFWKGHADHPVDSLGITCSTEISSCTEILMYYIYTSSLSFFMYNKGKIWYCIRYDDRFEYQFEFFVISEIIS